jgi:hypothetical protein
MAVRPHLVGTALPDAPIVTAAGTPTRLREVLGAAGIQRGASGSLPTHL